MERERKRRDLDTKIKIESGSNFRLAWSKDGMKANAVNSAQAF
jgi:hypothetical protein